MQATERTHDSHNVTVSPRQSAKCSLSAATPTHEDIRLSSYPRTSTAYLNADKGRSIWRRVPTCPATLYSGRLHFLNFFIVQHFEGAHGNAVG